MTLYGWLDDFGAVIRWAGYKPPDNRLFIIKRTPRKPAPTIETHGEALW